jgi:class 3 adenylate cyclase
MTGATRDPASTELLEPSDPVSRVRRSHILGLALVAALVLSGTLAIRLLVDVLLVAPPAINEGGRQRMLSQRLAKDALLLRQAATAGTIASSRRDLRETLAVWTQGHERLRRQVDHPDGSFSDPELRAVLARVDAPYSALREAGHDLLAALHASTPTVRDGPALERAVGRILEGERSYLSEMDRMVSLYEKKTSARVTRLRHAATLLTLSAVIVLAIVALFVLEPAVRLIRRRFVDTRRMIQQARTATHEVERRNEFIESVLGRYLSDQVVHRLLDTPEGLRLGGEERKVTLLMSDLRGFSALAAHLPPQKTVQLLNRYLESMTDVITDHGGTINEFEGDRIFAMFGAPLAAEDDTRRAAACALSMQLELERIDQDLEKEGLPRLRAGIALHTGTVVAGNIGSVKRAKYGVVGVAVVLTSRLEECALPGQVLASEATLEELGDEALLGPGVRVEVKGFEGPVGAFELLGLNGLLQIAPAVQEGPMARLPEGLPIGYRKVVGQHLGQCVLGGAITRLSAEQAEIQPARTMCCAPCSSECPYSMPVELQEELELSLNPTRPPARAAAVYAQVTKIVSGETPAFRVSFTSVPSAARTILDELLDRAGL